METFVDPSPEHFAHFKSLDRNSPILMLNMLRFREQAEYPEDHPGQKEILTGADAYREYGRSSAPIFQRVGGAIVWRGQFETTVIGPKDEQWDSVFIARYPNAHAFLAMVTDADYQKAVINRQAGVLTSRLVRFAEMPIVGAAFSD